MSYNNFYNKGTGLSANSSLTIGLSNLRSSYNVTSNLVTTLSNNYTTTSNNLNTLSYNYTNTSNLVNAMSNNIKTIYDPDTFESFLYIYDRAEIQNGMDVNQLSRFNGQVEIYNNLFVMGAFQAYNSLKIITSNIELLPSSQTFGSLILKGNVRSGYSGITLNPTGTAYSSFMDNNTDWGLFDNNNSRWAVRNNKSTGETFLHYQTQTAIATTSVGANIGSDMTKQYFEFSSGHYIDFHYGAMVNDYDARIIITGITNTSLSGTSGMTIECSAFGLPGISTGTGTSLVMSGISVVKSSSSKRYKNNIQDITDTESENILRNTRCIKYNPNPLTTVDKPESVYYGIVAEELDLVDKRLVNYNSNLEPESVLYERFVPILLKELRSLKDRVELLEKTKNHPG